MRPTVDPGTPLGLCREHLLEAHDWVARDVGVTDLLPSPCRACGSRVGVRYPSGWICAECEWRVGDVPDDELDRPRVEVVYYIRWRDQIKIGTSINPRMRLAALPHDEVLAFERGGRSLEQRRHAQFADAPLRRHGVVRGARRTARRTSPSSRPGSTIRGRSTSAGCCAASRSAARDPTARTAEALRREARTARSTAGRSPYGQCSCVRSPERSMSCSDMGAPHSGHAAGRAGTGSSSYGPSGGGPMYGIRNALRRSMKPA